MRARGPLRILSATTLGLLLVTVVPPATVAQESPRPPAPKGDPKASPEQGRSPSGEKPPAPPDSKPDPGKVVSSPILTAKLALMADPRLFPYEINVEMKDEGLILSGTVAQASQKEAAAEIVARVMKLAANHLQVDPHLAEKLARREDEAITQYVKDRFSKSTTLSKADFDVKTERGIVSLTGKTRFQVIVLEAAEAARHVPGVQAVKTDGVQLEAD